MVYAGKKVGVIVVVMLLAVTFDSKPVNSSIFTLEEEVFLSLDGYSSVDNRPNQLTDAPVLLAFSDSVTNNIVRRLQQGETECGRLPAEYRVDCMSQAYGNAAKAASRQDYQIARTELNPRISIPFRPGRAEC